MQISSIRNKKEALLLISKISKRTQETTFNHLCQHIENLEEMNTFIKIYNPQRQNHEEIENLNRNEIESVIKISLKTKIQGNIPSLLNSM